MDISLGHKSKSGFSLLEVSIALAVVSAALVMVFAGYSVTAQNQKVQTSAEQISKVKTVVQLQFTSKQYTTLDRSMARAYGAFRGFEFDSNGYPLSVWHTRIDIVGAATTYSITYQGVPKTVCVQMALTQAADRNLYSVQVGSAAARRTYYEISGRNSDVTSANMVLDCVDDPTDIKWIYR